MTARRVLILGAAGRDFHNFNVVYRDDPSATVVAFTAAQIPGIAGRRYPPSLAGPHYTRGIPIEDERDLETLCVRERVTEVVFAYSDVAHSTVMHLGSRALAAGADFVLLGPDRTMLSARVPVIAISAVRTGCGKSQVARWLGRHLRAQGYRVAVLRHPMPYGDLERQRVQRFASKADLDAARCTLEEREEYEPHLAAGNVVFAGVDYEAIVTLAQQNADLIIWDGGNNDFPFVRPNIHIVLVDALRPHEATGFHPGEAALRMADIVVVNKVDAAAATDIDTLIDEVRRVTPRALVVRAASPVTLENPSAVRGRRAIVVEDGPTITHGGMPYGAGYIAAVGVGAVIVDPRKNASPGIGAVYAQYPHIGKVLPALGYDRAQLQALQDTIDRSDADVVVAATPVDLAALVELDKPVVRASYGFADAGEPTLGALVDRMLGERRHPAEGDAVT